MDEKAPLHPGAAVSYICQCPVLQRPLENERLKYITWNGDVNQGSYETLTTCNYLIYTFDYNQIYGSSYIA